MNVLRDLREWATGRDADQRLYLQLYEYLHGRPPARWRFWVEPILMPRWAFVASALLYATLIVLGCTLLAALLPV